jgi:hypothetical protein
MTVCKPGLTEETAPSGDDRHPGRAKRSGGSVVRGSDLACVETGGRRRESGPHVLEEIV